MNHVTDDRFLPPPSPIADFAKIAVHSFVLKGIGTRDESGLSEKAGTDPQFCFGLRRKISYNSNFYKKVQIYSLSMTKDSNDLNRVKLGNIYVKALSR